LFVLFFSTVAFPLTDYPAWAAHPLVSSRLSPVAAKHPFSFFGCEALIPDVEAGHPKKQVKLSRSPPALRELPAELRDLVFRRQKNQEIAVSLSCPPSPCSLGSWHFSSGQRIEV
jgi:hypothetical protein